MSPSRQAIAICCGLVLGCASKAKPDSSAAPMTPSPAPAEAAAPEPIVEPGGGAAPAMDFDENEAAPVKQSEATSLADLRAELDGYETRLSQHGVRLRGYPPGAKRQQHKPRAPKVKKKGTPAPATTPSKPRDRCEDVCEIATAVCGLRDKICGLASIHENESEYEDACERAERDCERASEACDDCS